MSKTGNVSLERLDTRCSAYSGSDFSNLVVHCCRHWIYEETRSQIWQVANKTGWDDGGQNATASPNPPCTVNAVFCVPFTKAYDTSYKYHITYWEGVKAGNKYADHMIDTCTLTKH